MPLGLRGIGRAVSGMRGCGDKCSGSNNRYLWTRSNGELETPWTLKKGILGPGHPHRRLLTAGEADHTISWNCLQIQEHLMQNEGERRGRASPGSRLPSISRGPRSGEREGPFGGRRMRVERLHFTRGAQVRDASSTSRAQERRGDASHPTP